MKIFIGADHRGFHLKQNVIDYLKLNGHEVIDEGDKGLNAEDDFPQFAGRVASALLAEGETSARGILICGSGQGMCMAANRFKGIRACLGYDRHTVRESRNDEDSNVLCLPSDTLKSDQMHSIVDTWLDTPFANAPRYNRRIKEMDEL